MKTESLLIGSVDEIAEHLKVEHGVARLLGKGDKPVREVLTDILEEGALLGNDGIGQIFFFGSTHSTDGSGVPKVVNEMMSQHVKVISDKASATLKKHEEKWTKGLTA